MVEPVYMPVIGFARVLFTAMGLRFTVTGAEHVSPAGGAVVAMNHVGYLDFALVGYAFRPRRRLLRFMAKKEVFDHPVSGPLMRGMKHIPVDREAGADSYRAAVEALRRGELVGVFPEATISQSFELKDFKTGAVRMAQEAGVPVLPAIVWGSQRLWTKGKPRSLWHRGTEIRIALGEPYFPAGDPAVATGELKTRMQALLEQARSSYGGTPRTPDDTWWIPASVGGTAPTLDEAEAADAKERAERAQRRRAEDPTN